jgi:hypothetical protein
MRPSSHRLPVATSRVLRWWVCTIVVVVTTLAQSTSLAAQEHAHSAEPRKRDAQLELVLGGPHLILYHRGYLALGDAQITGLQRLQRSVCDAEVLYVEETEKSRARLNDLLSDTAPLPPRKSADAAKPTRLNETMNALAAAESHWLTALMHARRDALALLTLPQRAQVTALREHWVRETTAMIEEATRPGQRGHPGTQIPIRVPGMVVNETTLLPHCESLHGPSRHIVVPPPR